MGLDQRCSVRTPQEEVEASNISERKVLHDVGLEIQDATVAMPRRALGCMHQRDSVSKRRRSDMTWD